MIRRALVPLLSLLATGCHPGLGPRTMPRARFDYNEAIGRSQNEQLLLNVLRLRYQDTPTFLDVESIVASYKAEGSGGLSANGSFGQSDGSSTRSLGLSANLTFSESPTISYSPLQGEAFARRFLSPIPPAMVALLAQSGWGLERLLRCCAHSINDVPNTPSVGGYVPSRVLAHDRFSRLAGLVKDLQEHGSLEWSAEPDGEGGLPLVFSPHGDGDLARMAELRAMLSVKGEGPWRVVGPGTAPKAGDFVMRTRSLLGVMAFLAQGIDVPVEDLAAGRVRQAVGPDGRPFDWRQVLGGQFRVCHAEEVPDDAFVRVRFRGRWFYISDTDAEAKATFSLLSQLFSLQAAAGKAASPLLTVPVK